MPSEKLLPIEIESRVSLDAFEQRFVQDNSPERVFNSVILACKTGKKWPLNELDPDDLEAMKRIINKVWNQMRNEVFVYYQRSTIGE